MTTAEATFTGTLTTTSTYQVVTQTVSVPHNSGGFPTVFTVTAPAGLVPLSAGWRSHGSASWDNSYVTLTSCYPNGANGWTWELLNNASATVDATLPVDLYLVCASL